MLSFTRPYLGRLILAMTSMACLAALNTAPVFLSKQTFDSVFTKKDVKQAWEFAGLIVLVFFFKSIFAYLQDYLMGYIGHRVIQDLRNRLYSKLHELSLDFFTQEKTGQLMSRITYDAPAVRPGITDSFSRVVRDGLTVLALTAVAFYLNAGLAVLAFFIFPPALWVIYILGKKLVRASERSLASMGDLTSILQETLANIRIVKAFGMEAYEKSKFERENENLTAINIGYTRVTSRSTPISEFIGAIGIASFVGYGAVQVATGAATPGGIVAFCVAIVSLYRPIKGISELNSVVPMALAASDRILEILDAQPSVVERDGAR